MFAASSARPQKNELCSFLVSRCCDVDGHEEKPIRDTAAIASTTKSTTCTSEKSRLPTGRCREHRRARTYRQIASIVRARKVWVLTVLRTTRHSTSSNLPHLQRRQCSQALLRTLPMFKDLITSRRFAPLFLVPVPYRRSTITSSRPRLSSLCCSGSVRSMVLRW